MPPLAKDVDEAIEDQVSGLASSWLPRPDGGADDPDAQNQAEPDDE
jgi:hypothetical protein